MPDFGRRWIGPTECPVDRSTDVHECSRVHLLTIGEIDSNANGGAGVDVEDRTRFDPECHIIHIEFPREIPVCGSVEDDMISRLLKQQCPRCVDSASTWQAD